MARRNREAKRLKDNAMPSLMENKSRLVRHTHASYPNLADMNLKGGNYATNALILFSTPLLAVFALYLGFQQPFLLVLHSYLPRRLDVYLPARLWEATPAVILDGTLSPRDLLKACEGHQYTTEIISLDPLLIYINNFTSAQEAEELIKLGWVSLPRCHKLEFTHDCS